MRSAAFIAASEDADLLRWWLRPTSFQLSAASLTEVLGTASAPSSSLEASCSRAAAHCSRMALAGFGAALTDAFASSLPSSAASSSSWNDSFAGSSFPSLASSPSSPGFSSSWATITASSAANSRAVVRLRGASL